MTYRAITGILEARTALHVGGGQGSEVADAMLRRDTQGRPLIPGTALAGALRSLLTRLGPQIQGAGLCRALYPPRVLLDMPQQPCGCAVCRLMGDVVPADEGDTAAYASRLLVYNAALMDETQPMIRDGVGINRTTGAAARAAAAKFDLEVLPAGSRFFFRMELREPQGDGDLAADEQLLVAGLSEWMAGRLALGGDVSRGLGAFDLREVRYLERDLDDPDALITYLSADRPWVADPNDTTARDVTARLLGRRDEIEFLGAKTAETQALDAVRDATNEALDLNTLRMPLTTGWAAWTLTLKADGPLLTHDPNTAGLNGFDHAPLLENLGDWQHPVLPGSGLRGVLRSQAERIARMLVTHRAYEAQGETPGEYFRAHCPACDPLAARKRDDVRGVILESCDSLLRHEKQLDENTEVTYADLCLACQLFGSTRNGSRLRIEDAPFTGGEPVYKILDFLAVDRFTGGGAEHLNFDALALWQPEFELRIVLENPAPWELGWLSLVLRDLAEGWLRVGYGAAKGFGKVIVPEGKMELATLNPGYPPADSDSLFTVEAWAWGDAALQVRQKAWVQVFADRLVDISKYRQSGEMVLPADSYFNGRIDRLYPVSGGE